jgi:molecular chaperone HscB
MSQDAQKNYFAFFGLPLHLRLDGIALEKQFYAMSRKLHPDRFASKPAAEQEAALAESSRLNDAYRTLKDPILRTQHLLTLEGVELEEQSKAATDAARASGEQKKQIVPPELLEEVFELNMQLEEMRMNRKMGEDDPQLRQDLEAARIEFESRLAAVDSNLTGLWALWDAALEPEDIERAKIKEEMVAILDRRRYLRNLVRDVNEALEG